MEHLIAQAPQQFAEGPSHEYPLKPAKTTDYDPICHPPCGGASLSTASGASTTFGSFSSFTTTSVPSFEEPEATSFTNSASFISSSSSSSSWSGSSSSTRCTFQPSKHHYIGVINSAAHVTPLTSSAIPSNAVSLTDTSPAWAQYQFTTTSIGSSSSSSSGCAVSGCCTPLYCSLTPTTTKTAFSSAPSFPAEETPRSPQSSASTAAESRQKGATEAAATAAAAAAAATATAATNTPPAASACTSTVRRRSSLLLNEQPLPVASLPEEVQAALQQDRTGPLRSSSVPDWFDIQTGCIKKELLPQLPTFRSTLNTSVARLSVASRVHHRIRWPGEPAKVSTSSMHHLHRRPEASAAAAAATAASRSSLAPSGTPTVAAAAAAAAAAASPAALQRRKSDSFAVSPHSRNSAHMPLRSSSHFFAPESSFATSAAADDEARNAAAQMPRNRRVRFATVPSAREYRELSPYKEAGPTPTSSAAAMGAAVPPSCAAHISYPQEEAAAAAGGGAAAAEQPRVAAADNHVSGGVCSRSTSLLNQMTQMVQRLLNYPPLQQHQESKEKLQESLQLLQAFRAECSGRPPSLSYFGDRLESCERLVEDKLPAEEEGPLESLVQTASLPFLSREAVFKLHRMRLQMQHPPELDIFLTPLEILQRLRICERRRATSGLCLHAATADESILDGEMHVHPNVFFLKDFACGVVSTRRWQLSRTPRAFAASVLQQLQQLLQQHVQQQQQQSVSQGASCASGEAEPVDVKPSLDSQRQTHFSLTPLVEAALQKTTERGCCSLGLLSMDESGEKVRFATCGFMRLLVLRRSAASGILCRVTEAPMRNAAIAAETQLFRWPGVEELLGKSSQDSASPWRREHGTGREKPKKSALDPGARRQGLMRIVEWADTGNPWSCRGLVEQEVFVQEGDFFIIADEILFEVVTCEEMRHLFSCCLTSVEKMFLYVWFQSQDATDVSLCIAPSCLCMLLKRLWRQRVPNLQVLLSRLEERKQKLIAQATGRRAVNETLDACPLDLSIAAGWIRKPPSKDTNTQAKANTETDNSTRISANADTDTEEDSDTNSDASRDS